MKVIIPLSDNRQDEKAPFNGRFKGRKPVHHFCQPFGYPILLCSWEWKDEKRIAQTNDSVDCKNCLRELALHRPSDFRILGDKVE